MSELLISPYQVVKIFALESWIQANRTLINKGTEVVATDEATLKKMSHHQTPPSVMAITAVLPETPAPPRLKGKLTLALDTIQDPGNLGTIIRIADWYGITHILCSAACADYMNPKCLSASMGSFTRVTMLYTDLETAISQSGLASYACVLNGKSLYELPVIKEGIILIGNEGKGLSESLIRMASEHISIPRVGKAESLNAAIAAAIVCDNLVSRKNLH